jgi:hypothetical protein
MVADPPGFGKRDVIRKTGALFRHAAVAVALWQRQFAPEMRRALFDE